MARSRMPSPRSSTCPTKCLTVVFPPPRLAWTRTPGSLSAFDAFQFVQPFSHAYNHGGSAAWRALVVELLSGFRTSPPIRQGFGRPTVRLRSPLMAGHAHRHSPSDLDVCTGHLRIYFPPPTGRATSRPAPVCGTTRILITSIRIRVVLWHCITGCPPAGAEGSRHRECARAGCA